MLGNREFFKGKGKVAVVSGAVAAVMMVSGVSAFFTANQVKTNTWTVGSVTISLEEPGYDSTTSEHQNITPNKQLTKDPFVKNTGNNDAYVFMKVTVPKANVKTASLDGTKVTAGIQELFDYTVDPEWTIIDTKNNTDSNTYVLAYGTATECKALKPSASTPVLFKNSKITFKNVIEGQGLENKTLELPVEAYAIQTVDLFKNGDKTPAAVWNLLSNQNKA